MDYHLKEKVVLVTGAGSGIGAEVARAFCREEATTIFVDIDEQGLEAALAGYEEWGSPMVCDVSNAREVEDLFARIRAKYGALHVLVNSAAVCKAAYVQDIEEEDLERAFAVNMKGYVYTTMQAVPLMKAAHYGRLIYINSASGLKASAGLAVYSASKYFDRGFAIAAALEVGRHNITSNSICPSDVYPEGSREARSWCEKTLLQISLEKEEVRTFEELKQKRTARNPMRRSCTAMDVAALALFLASEQAGFINGQSVGLNGGALPWGG